MLHDYLVLLRILSWAYRLQYSLHPLLPLLPGNQTPAAAGLTLTGTNQLQAFLLRWGKILWTDGLAKDCLCVPTSPQPKPALRSQPGALQAEEEPGRTRSTEDNPPDAGHQLHQASDIIGLLICYWGILTVLDTAGLYHVPQSVARSSQHSQLLGESKDRGLQSSCQSVQDVFVLENWPSDQAWSGRPPHLKLRASPTRAKISLS